MKVVKVTEQQPDEFATGAEARVFEVEFTVGSALVWYGLPESHREDGWREEGRPEAYLPGDGSDCWASSELADAVRSDELLDFHAVADMARDAVYDFVSGTASNPAPAARQ